MADPLGPGGGRGRIVTAPSRRSRFQWAPFILVGQNHTTYWREDTDTAGTDFGDLLAIDRAVIVVDNSAAWADGTRALRERHPAFDYNIGRGERTEFMCTDDDEPGFNINYETEWCTAWGLSRKRLIAAGVIQHNTGRYPWHLVIDPVNFFGHAHVATLETDDDLYRWACEYRDWCQQRDIRIATSKGGTAAKILRTVVDEPQCKVPITTNAAIRPHLCSSHIRTYTAPREVIDVAIEYDQKGAFHECARTVPLPDRNNFVVKGDFHQRTQVWYEPGDDEWHTLLHREYGLLLCTVEQYTENQYRRQYPLSPWMPWTDEPIALFSNELVLARRCGLHVTGIIAAWTSANRSVDLARHAVIAQAELAATTDPFTLQWLKPMNLSVYGMTASVPHASRGRTLDGDKKDGPFFECQTNHVAWLGMLQAEVRKRSLMLATDLDAAGARIVSVYADAIYVDVGNQDTDTLVPQYFTETVHHKLRVRNNMLASEETLKAPGLALTDPNRVTRANDYLDA